MRLAPALQLEPLGELPSGFLHRHALAIRRCARTLDLPHPAQHALGLRLREPVSASLAAGGPDLALNNSANGGGGIASGTGNGDTAGNSLVTLNKSVVTDNTATGGPAGGGGGMSNGGTLVSNNSQVTGNMAPGSLGGGILNHAGATLNKTVVSGNSALDDPSGDTGAGGGIANANFGNRRAEPRRC